MFTPGNFLKLLRQRMVRGGGFIRSAMLSPIDFKGLTTGLNLNGTVTSCGISTAEAGSGASNEAVVLMFDNDANGTQGACQVRFDVPIDYDSSTDYLKLVLRAKNNNGITRSLAVTGVILRLGESATLAISSGRAFTIDATQTTFEEEIVDLSGLGLVPGDSLTIALTASAVNSGIDVYNGEFRYRSNLVPTDRTLD